jgi:hypothetical protein
MTADELVNKLLEHAITRGEVLRRIGVIRDFLEQKFFKPESQPLSDFVGKRDTGLGDARILTNLEAAFWESFTRDNVYHLLDEMTATINRLPTVTLYIPYETEHEELSKLIKWFRANVNERIMVDLRQDKALVGGCALAAGGVWHDYTLRYWIKKRQGAIIETIGKYVNSKNTNPTN